MDRAPSLNVIRLGDEWLVTNGELTAEGRLRFPEGDPAEELFLLNGPLSGNAPPAHPSAPPREP